MTTADLPTGFRPEDVRIELESPYPVGGQYAGSRLYDMIATHTPTGIVVRIPALCARRSQHRQRNMALSAIEWILLNDD
jgi:protein subunit release factor A